MGRPLGSKNKPKDVAPPGTTTNIPTIGDNRPLPSLPVESFTQSDMNFVTSLQRAMSASNISTRNPMWNDDLELSIKALVSPNTPADIERALSFTMGNLATTSPINPRFAKRHPVADLNIPRDPVAVLQVAYRYAYENPFVAKACKVKTDFICKDFRHRTHNDKVREFYDDYAVMLNLRINLRKIVWNLTAIGVCPIWWGGEDGGPIKFIQVLDPRTCHILHGINGVAKLYLKVDASMIDAVRDPQGQKNVVNKAVYDSLPAYWVTQIQNQMNRPGIGINNALIELKDGSYTVIENSYAPMSRAVGSLDGLPLQPAFDALQRYRLMAAGDFAVSWNVKNMITLISEGDPKAEGKDYKPMDGPRMQRLASQFINNADQSLQVVCDPTTDIRFVFPPMEIYNPTKYAQVEKEIKEVLNLPSFMWQNNGSGAYGSAMAEIKMLREEVDALRMILQEQFFRPLYMRLRDGKRGGGFKVSDVVFPCFDNNSLRDDTVWIANLSEGYSKGYVSFETMVEALGLDPQYEKENKKAEHEDPDTSNTASGKVGEPLNNSTLRPTFEPSQGNMNPVRDSGGNDGSPRSPRTSGK